MPRRPSPALHAFITSLATAIEAAACAVCKTSLATAIEAAACAVCKTSLASAFMALHKSTL